MIAVTINDKKYQVRNLFDEITIEEFDKIQHIMVKGENEIHTRLKIIEVVGDIPLNILFNLSVSNFLQISDNLFIDGNYTAKNKYLDYKLKKDISAGNLIKIEKIIKSDSDEKNSLILSVLFTGDIDNEFIKGIKKEKASDFIGLITQLEILKQ